MNNKFNSIVYLALYLLICTFGKAMAGETWSPDGIMNLDPCNFQAGTVFQIALPTNPDGTGAPRSGPTEPYYAPTPMRGPNYAARPRYANGTAVPWHKLVLNNGGHFQIGIILDQDGAGHIIYGTFTIGPDGNPILVAATSNSNEPISGGRELKSEQRKYLTSRLPKNSALPRAISSRNPCDCRGGAGGGIFMVGLGAAHQAALNVLLAYLHPEWHGTIPRKHYSLEQIEALSNTSIKKTGIKFKFSEQDYEYLHAALNQDYEKLGSGYFGPGTD